MTTVPPIRRQVRVQADRHRAFTVFTAGIERWWPLADLSVFGADARVSFDEGHIVEVSAQGERRVWGTVTRWDPGALLAFTWHPGQPAERASHVEVRFDPVGPTETMVTLEHRGWEVFDDPGAARTEYDRGWPGVLEAFSASAGGDGSRHEAPAEESGAAPAGGEATWVALFHRPGPAAPQQGSIFGDPRFMDHAAFLSRCTKLVTWSRRAR